MPARKLKEYLDAHGVKYISIVHSPAYTAQEIAASAHIPGRAMAKVVIVDLDGELAMAVLPATCKVVLQDLRQLTGCDRASFATEEAFEARFPDCEIGAMPPFGNLYGMKVYAAESLRQNPTIAFNAGTHTEVIQMAWADFERLVQPTVASFTT